jgi:2-methylcitrate dehydratase PrpD
MAQKGIGGSKESLEGKAALFQSFLDGYYDRNFLVDDLGKKFYIADLGFKAWPCNGIAQPYVEATLDIVKTHNIQPQNIDEIVVFVSDFAKLLVEPLPKRLNPQTTMDAKGSLPYIVAVAATRRNVKIEDFTTSGIKNADVLRLAQRVKPQYDAQLAGGQRGWTGISPGRVGIKTADGKNYTSKNPMSKEQHIVKFEDCAAYSAKPLSSDDIKTVIQMIDNLETIKDVSEIVKILS